ncbi:hypothetical protein SASPL_110234 [Salvia splendens]|uniref:Uncharacterized protein n=1 Tax=Salvia splendens TaxID=180675 RepID=A0A8X8Y4F5_SALSN|nr:hypothetical protein SASPL_110234 [Salvia splendens]
MIAPTVGKTLLASAVIFISVVLALILFSPSFRFTQTLSVSPPSERAEIWILRRLIEWRPCNWWLQGHLVG